MAQRYFSGVVKDGDFKPHTYEEKTLENHLQKLEGKQCKLSISQEHAAASYPQTKYLFGVVYKMIGDELGEEDPEEVHKEMATMFNYEKIKVWDEATGKQIEVRIPKSISDHTTVERSEYIEKIRMWASKFLGMYIPDPQEIMPEIIDGQ